MSVRVDTSSLISGALVLGNRGLGVLGSDVPSTGDDGPGYIYNDLSLPGDAGKEVRGLITVPPTGLTSFFAYEDSSFTASGPDGSYTFTYRLFVDGADLGTAVATINIGDGGSVATPAAGAATVSAAGASTAATTATAAAGAATVSGVGSSAADGTASAVAAAGVASVSAAGSSVAASTATAAAGVATVSGVGEGSAAGQASAIPADGVAAVSAVGSSVAATTATPAAGVATVAAFTAGASSSGDGAGRGRRRRLYLGPEERQTAEPTPVAPAPKPRAAIKPAPAQQAEPAPPKLAQALPAAPKTATPDVQQVQADLGAVQAALDAQEQTIQAAGAVAVEQKRRRIEASNRAAMAAAELLLRE